MSTFRCRGSSPPRLGPARFIESLPPVGEREASPPPPPPPLAKPPAPLAKPTPTARPQQQQPARGAAAAPGPVPQSREGFEATKAKFSGGLAGPEPPKDPRLALEEKVDALCKELLPKVGFRPRDICALFGSLVRPTLSVRPLQVRSLEELQAQHARQIQLLTKDLDDERKLRACLEIEVDRLNKLIVTTYAQV